MAARDILSLDTSMAPRLVRILYGLTLILIALGVVLGLMQGVRTATRTPLMPPLTAQANPAAAQGQMPGQDMRGQGLRGQRFAAGRDFGPGRFGQGRFGPRRAGPFGLRPGRQPVLFGAFMMVRTLVAGFIALLVVRILAEMALAMLALPRRGEA